MSNIVIKELFPSDPLSSAAEKINYNFDQLMLAGGGPPGIQGGIGPTGPHGPAGTRGSLWFTGTTGITSTYTGETLNEGDQLLVDNGDVFDWAFDLNIFDWAWVNSGINLKGPTGGSGSTGGSFEWQFFWGSTGNAADILSYGPTAGDPSTVESSNVDFIVPVSPNKNSIFLGDRQWFYNRLSNFNVIPDGSGSTGTFQGDVPKITVIQREVNYAGLNGIAFGAVGLTSSASSIPSIGDLTAPVNALDFVHLGFIREATLPEYHSFFLNSFRMPMRIQIGGDTSNYEKADLRINSFQFRQSNYDDSRVIFSGQTGMAWGSGSDQSFIEIFARHNQYSLSGGLTGGTAGYVSIQGTPGSVFSTGADHPYGYTIIGPTYSNVGTYRGFVGSHPSALIISRTINTYNTDSSIKFFSPDNLSSVNDYVAKMVALSGSDGKSLQIAGRRIGISGVFASNSVQLIPKFPFHVVQQYSNRKVGGYTGAYQNSLIDGWIAGFDSYDSSDGVYAPAGIGFGYANPGIPFGGYQRFPIIQTYYGASSVVGNTPTLSMQIGDEDTDGNLMLGITPLPGVYAAKSKLTVFGSINVGPTSFMSASIDKGPTFGIRSSGSILQGVTSYLPLSTQAVNSGAVQSLIGDTYGIYTSGRSIARNFIATHNGNVSVPGAAVAYAVGDLYSGIKGMTYTGEFRAVVKNGNQGSTEIARFTSNGENSDSALVPGFQVLSRSADKPLYVSAGDLAATCQLIPGPTSSAEKYVLATIPTSRSVVVLEGNGSHWNATLGSNIGWKYQGGLNVGLTAGQIVVYGYFMVELEDGAYDGQEVEIVSNGWGVFGLYPENFSQPAFTLRNNARWMFSGTRAKMILSKEFNGGGNVDGFYDYGTDGPTNPGYGLPYPFPHGAKQAGPSLSSESVDPSKWSAQGQCTIFGYKSIRLRWMRICPTSNLSNLDSWRWVEISRSSRSIDETLSNTAYPGDTGFTIG